MITDKTPGSWQDAGGKRKICDLGLAAFVKLRGFTISDIRRDHIVINCATDAEWRRISEMEIEYINSEFCKFDGMMMELRRMPVAAHLASESNLKQINCLGQAAFMQMFRSRMVRSNPVANPPWHMVARTRVNVWAFETAAGEDDLWLSILSGWPNDQMREFNQEIVALKLLRRRTIGGQHSDVL